MLQGEKLGELPALKWKGNRGFFLSASAGAECGTMRASCGSSCWVQPCLSLILVGTGAWGLGPHRPPLHSWRGWQGQQQRHLSLREKLSRVGPRVAQGLGVRATEADDQMSTQLLPSALGSIFLIYEMGG